MSEEREGYWERIQKEPLYTWLPQRAIGLVLAGFAVLFFFGPLGGILKTESEQVGFRGTGMVQINEDRIMRAAQATLALIPEDEEPYPHDPDDLAADFYENVQVLGHVSVDNFNRIMNAITQWVSPEQGCAYCHGEDGNFVHDDIYAKVVARRMIQMTQNINAEWQDHVGATGVNCYTCHRGLNVPANIWFDAPEQTAGMLGWSNGQNTPNPRAAYASLPGGVFEKYLVGDEEIRVIHDGLYGDDNAQDIKATEHSFSLMIHMSTSLGVNCTYCHNTRSMNVWDQGPPQRTTAWYGIRMVRELNNEYLNPLGPVYPAHRLGVTGDAPKANCSTCHAGVNKPLKGTPMIENWPELAAPAPAESQAALQ